MGSEAKEVKTLKICKCSNTAVVWQHKAVILELCRAQNSKSTPATQEMRPIWSVDFV